jgi:sugar lactone lactonase YvrE
MIANPEGHLPNNRFNDGKCDPAGRFWAGTMSINEEPNTGNVYMLGVDLSFEKKISGVSISNGMAWSADQRTFYYIDTPSFEVAAYSYDKTTGNISNKTTIMKILKEEGNPDGMTIDNEGMLWIAHWDGWQITRRDPQTGEKLLQISLPVSRVTSCCFGGENFADLYITSAREGLSDEDLQKQPLAGSLFVIRNCGYKGIPGFEFPVVS